MRRAARRSATWLSLAQLDLRDRLRGERDPLAPPRRYRLAGWHTDRRRVGEGWMEILENEIRLRGDERVLDIGCGPGRIAAPLTGRLDRGSYEGFDVDRNSIRWCQRAITRRYPRFRFQVTDVYNARYNPGGSRASGEYRFPFPDADFDLVLSLSVFTHMTPTDTARYLHEAARVMRSGGRLLATYFLLNEETERRQADGGPSPRHRLHHELADSEGRRYRSRDAETPEAMIAQFETDVRDMHEGAGLEIERINRGRWSSGTPGRSQDLIVAVKP